MAVTIKTDVVDFEILTNTIQGQFAHRNALLNSVLTQSGAIAVEPTFPGQGADVIGQLVTVPYFGTLPAFVNNPDGSSITPAKIAMGSGLAPVSRSSLAFQASAWARASATEDPYGEMARQAEEQAQRRIEELIIEAAAGSELLVDLTSDATDVLTYDHVVYAMTEAFGQDFMAAVAMAAHPLTLAGLATLKDSAGNYLLTSPQNGSVQRLFNIPVIGSPRTPKTGSVMGAVTPSGTAPPTATLTGTPLDAFKQLVLKCVLAGDHETATFRFSTNGGMTWSADIVTPAVGTPLELRDTATDSLVGVNGETGISVTFAAGTFSADNEWRSVPNFTVETQVYLPGAGAFWYNRDALELLTDKDILAHTEIAALHLYGVAHCYRRRLGGHTPGVLRIRHKVKGYRGV